MTDTKEDIVILIKKRPDWFVLITSLLWIIFTPIMAIYFVIQIYTENMPIDSLAKIFFPIFYVIGEIYIIKVFLWHYRGQEKITLTTEILKIEKKGSILNFPDTYKIEKIKNISLAKKNWLENKTNVYKLSGGEIQFLYFGEIIKFGQTLKLEEAKKIISQLNQEIKTTNR